MYFFVNLICSPPLNRGVEHIKIVQKCLLIRFPEFVRFCVTSLMDDPISYKIKRFECVYISWFLAFHTRELILGCLQQLLCSVSYKGHDFRVYATVGFYLAFRTRQTILGFLQQLLPAYLTREIILGWNGGISG